MRETPFFFDRADWHLFGVYHEPEGAERLLPFLFCHPFAEEKLWAHRVFVNFARQLAKSGHPVLRFDYIGNGDSGGEFCDSSIESALADIEAAAGVLKDRTGAARIGLLGLRLGASLAYKTAARRGDVDALVLWSPIMNGGRYLQELLRINLTTQMAAYREIREDREVLMARLVAGDAVNVDGYEIAPTMAEQLNALSLLTADAVPGIALLIVQIDRNHNARPAEELQALQGRLAGAELKLVQEEPFWKEIQRFYDTAPNLFTTTLNWMNRT